MKSFYCIIQGRGDYGWEKLISDKIEAETKADARKQLEDEYKRKLPMRILSKNLNPDSLLLSIYEMVPGTYENVWRMFELQKCVECEKTFKPIDGFNLNSRWGGFDTCSHECQKAQRQSNFVYEDFNVSVPVIYQVSNWKTKKCYIGQTIRSFTLRWWEHIKSTDNSKFHKALKESEITDWNFSILEVVKDVKDLDKREMHWIKCTGSIDDGYNTLKNGAK